MSNSSPKSKVQTSVLGLGVDLVSQQEQQQQEQEEEPPPKSKLEFNTEDQVLFPVIFSFLDVYASQGSTLSLSH